MDVIATGSPANPTFSFAVISISVGVSFAVMLATTTIISDLKFIIYLNLYIICLLVGIITLAFWLQARSSVNITVTDIKSRLIVPTPVQESSSGNLTGI